MDSQNLQDKNGTTCKGRGRRRFIKQVGVTTPVIMSLSSPSVFGVGCLSQQLSGNTSHPHDSCVIGQSPDYWKDPTNISAWLPSGYDYSDGNPPSGSGVLCSDYTGGTTFETVFVGSGVTDPLRKVLCDNSGSESSAFVAAILNAKTVSNYVMTPQQVLDLYNGTTPAPPGYANMLAFLTSTWTP